MWKIIKEILKGIVASLVAAIAAKFAGDFWKKAGETVLTSSFSKAPEKPTEVEVTVTQKEVEIPEGAFKEIMGVDRETFMEEFIATGLKSFGIVQG